MHIIHDSNTLVGFEFSFSKVSSLRIQIGMIECRQVGSCECWVQSLYKRTNLESAVLGTLGGGFVNKVLAVDRSPPRVLYQLVSIGGQTVSRYAR